MATSASEHDVVVVGASIAGCTAAILLARQGARVAIVERTRDLAAYKKICTHYIQSSAVPTLARLGIEDGMRTAGAIGNGAHVWTRWGWIRPRDLPDSPRVRGYNLRRSMLDPLLRAKAAATDGVELIMGETARALVMEGGRARGVETDDADGASRTRRARLVIGADGRNSRVAKLAGLPMQERPHGRFAYFGYYRDVDVPTYPESMMWLCDPDVAYAFPNDDSLTVLACFVSKEKLPAFKSDPERALVELIGRMPDAPDLSRARLEGQLLGMIDLPNTTHEPIAPGVALAGDASLASDPLWGVGCGWAFQSAEWLADAVAPALGAGGDAAVDDGLRRYRKRHRAGLAGHHGIICDFSVPRPPNFIERLMMSAATRDAVMARHFEAFGSRSIGVPQFLAPAKLARAAWVNLTRAGSRSTGTAAPPPT